MAVLSYVLKNMAIILGIVEYFIKAIAGVVSLTPTKKDDSWVAAVDVWFSKIKAFLYSNSDKLVA